MSALCSPVPMNSTITEPFSTVSYEMVGQINVLSSVVKHPDFCRARWRIVADAECSRVGVQKLAGETSQPDPLAAVVATTMFSASHEEVTTTFSAIASSPDCCKGRIALTILLPRKNSMPEVLFWSPHRWWGSSRCSQSRSHRCRGDICICA